MTAPSIYVFTGTSGAGRKTIARVVGSALGWTFVRSCTTRPPRRPAEQDEDYHYVSREQFDAWDGDGSFAQTVTIEGHRYGILGRELETAALNGRGAYVVLNRAGADDVMKRYGERAVRIFVYVDKITLRERLESKGASYSLVESYLERYADEVTYRSQCEYVFENVNANKTAERIVETLSRG
ncbi:guanylate kinase [Cohnella sp. GCM10027633]|uniref:guanylate kinase n=1 Tax=unclassified Cohnella TaxID=2636738 RepID=UPI00363B910C